MHLAHGLLLVRMSCGQVESRLSVHLQQYKSVQAIAVDGISTPAPVQARLRFSGPRASLIEIRWMLRGLTLCCSSILLTASATVRIGAQWDAPKPKPLRRTTHPPPSLRTTASSSSVSRRGLTTSCVPIRRGSSDWSSLERNCGGACWRLGVRCGERSIASDEDTNRFGYIALSGDTSWFLHGIGLVVHRSGVWLVRLALAVPTSFA